MNKAFLPLAAFLLMGCVQQASVQHIPTNLAAVAERVEALGGVVVVSTNEPAASETEWKVWSTVDYRSVRRDVHVFVEFNPVIGGEDLGLLARKRLNDQRPKFKPIPVQLLDEVCKLKGLTNLSLRQTDITDAELNLLSNAWRLEYLDLSGTRIEDSTILEVTSTLKNLELLHLTGTSLSDDTIRRLHARPNLTIFK